MSHTLPAWSVRLIEDLRAMDQRMTAVAGGLSAEQLNWRAADHAWSIGQCVEHLRVANDVYLPPMAQALRGQPQAPTQAITPGRLSRWFIRSYIEPSSESRRSRAPRKIAPIAHIDPSIVEAFLRSNEAVRDLVLRASAYDVNRIRFKNPFVPLLRFTIGTGLEIVAAHQRRHLLQAERVREAMMGAGGFHRP